MSKLINNITRVFTQTLKGGLIIIGNTCTVVGENNDKVRQFLTPSGGYTSNWRECGSSAFLDIPNGSKIKFAILEWHSTVANSLSNGIISESYLPIIFKTPDKIFNISINNETFSEAQYKDDNNLVHSVKWADVTDNLNKFQNGMYSVERIPTATPFENINSFNDHDQRLGWSLAVVYENHQMPTRYIEVNIGLKKQCGSIPKKENAVTLSGFKSSNKSYLSIVAMNGSPNLQSGLSTCKNILSIDDENSKNTLGNSTSTFFKNPNAKPIVPYNNIFSGIIMNTNTESKEYGELDTRGTLGNKNNTPFDINNTSSFIGNRGKLDILSFDISEILEKNQDTLTITTDIFNKDNKNSFEMITYAIQVDLDEEIAFDLETQATSTLNLSVIKTCVRKTVTLNEPAHYTIEVSNTSSVPLTNVFLMDYLPVNASLVKESITIDGNPVTTGSMFDFSGLPLTNLAVGTTKTIDYQITFYALPVISPVKILPQLSYSYTSNQETINENFKGISTSLNVVQDPVTLVSLFANTTTLSSGDTLLYTLILQNNGLSTAKEINLKDVLPNGLNYVANSTILNGTPLQGDITTGLQLPDMPPESEYLITFQVLVN